MNTKIKCFTVAVFLFAGAVNVNADCQGTIDQFLKESGLKKVHLKLKPWTKIQSLIESSSLSDKEAAKKCILPLNPKYPYKDKV